MLLVLATLFCGIKTYASSEILGAWEGEMKMGKMSLRMILSIEENAAEQTIQATISYPDRGMRDLPVNALLFNDPDLLFEFDGFGGAFRGRFNEAHTAFTGSWDFNVNQGPRMLEEMTFKRTEDTGLEAVNLDFDYAEGDPKLKGLWRGRIQVAPELEFGMVFRMGTDANKALKGFLDIPEQGAKDIPVTLIEFDAPDVFLGLQGLGMELKGLMAGDGQSWTATMDAFGGEKEVQFERLSSLSALEKPALSFEAGEGNEKCLGYWEGSLDVQGTVLRLAIALGVSSDGEYHGTMDSLDQNVRGIPMSRVSLNEGEFEFKWSAMGATYSGQLVDDGSEIVGKFKQGPISVPLTMKRQAGPPAGN